VSLIANLENLLSQGRDDALLRFSLGDALLKQGRAEEAVMHFERAVAQDAGYSAAWKLLGRAYTETGAFEKAVKSFEEGIAVAESKGDIQAAREMTVFLKRLTSR